MSVQSERERIEKVKEYLNLELNLKDELQDITSLASEICEKPISLITLLDENINWIRASTGVDLSFSPRETSFCQYVMNSDDTLVIEDTNKDARLKDNPLVHDNPGIRFYAGTPLVTTDGFRLGTLCVLDMQPSTLTRVQKRTLEVLSRQVVFLLEAELSKVKIKEKLDELEQKNESLRTIAQIQSHDIRQPLASIMGLLNLAEEDIVKLDKEWLSLARSAAEVLDSKIRSVVNESLGNHDIKLMRFNKMVEEIEDYAILLLNANGIIENWNRGAEGIKGYKTREIVGRNFSVFYTEEQLKEKLPQKLLETARRDGISRDIGLRVKKDGTTFKARVVITAIHNEKGEVIGFTKVTRDISKE